MANRFKGEVAVQHEGREYVLVLDFNTLADFEDKTGRDPLSWLDGVGKGSVKLSDMRAMVWAAMTQQEPDATIRDAGALLSEYPDVLTRLVQAAAPEAQGAQEGNAPRPQRRAKG